MINLIVNPMAKRGKGLSLVETAKDILAKENIEYQVHLTKYPKHATEIAYDLVLSGADTIVSCGGDGTINEVVNGIIKANNKLEAEGKKSNVKLGLLPCGTGNDFIRSAEMEVNITDATYLLINGTAKPADAIKVDNYYEISFACQGIDAEIVKLVNESSNKTQSSYFKKLIKCIFKKYTYNYQIYIKDKVIEKEGILLAVLNGGKVASGMKFCPLAKIDDGLMDVVLFEKASLPRVFKTIIALYRGKVLERPGVLHYQCKKCKIKSNQNILDIDGELFENLNFNAEVVPNALSIIR